MKDFLIRIIFVFIIIFIYQLGDTITETYDMIIELRFILPIISLVFWDYYLRIFENLLLRFNLVEKTVIYDDDNNIVRIKLKFQLLHYGNNTMHFKINDISIKNVKITPRITVASKEYYIAEQYECFLNKTKSIECFSVDCGVSRSIQRKIFLSKFYSFSFVLRIEYKINSKAAKIKNIHFFEIRRK